MFRKSVGPLAAIATAITALVLVLSGAPSALTAVAGLPLVLLLPGYALTGAFMHRHTFTQAERVLLALGTSLAIAILGAFVLNMLPAGLQPSSWAWLLAGVTIVGSVGSLVRGSFEASTEREPRERQRLNLTPLAQFGLAITIAVAAIGVARVGASQQQTGFTQLWMLPATATLEHNVRLGVHSAELAPTQYMLQLAVDGTVVTTWSHFTLPPGESWEAAATLPAASLGHGRIEARLYRLDDPAQPYRTVTL